MSQEKPYSLLLITHKSFIRLHLNYDDILYDKPENENFQSKL